jgi:hypothetical protein
MNVRGRHHAIIVLLLLLSSSLPAQDKQPTGSVTVVPFVRIAGLVYVELSRSGGSKLLALLDTGANASAVDSRAAPRLPAERATEVVGTTGSVEAEIVNVTQLHLGGFALPDLQATRRSLAGLPGPDGRPVDLILGSDAFARLALTLDFRRSLLEIGTAPRPEATGYVPMILDNGVPAIPAQLDGTAVTLRIDTGASLFETRDVYVNVPTPVWDSLRARSPGLTAASHLQGTGAHGSTVSLPVVRIPGAKIGPLSFDSVFIIVQPPLGYFASPEAKGFVGNNYLEKLGRVTLDFGRRRLTADSL